MKQPCIALDVSKGKSHYQGWIDADHKCGNALMIEHNLEGFTKIRDKARELEGITSQKPIVVFEATGVYHKSLQCYLEENDMEYMIISPLASAKVRKSNIRSTKTDKRDCKNIAKAYFEKDFRIHQKQDEIYDNLLVLNRYYNYLTEQLKKIKVEYRLLLDIVFPKFDQLYVKNYSEIPMALLKKYHHPDQLKNKKPESLAKYLEKTTCHHYEWCYRESLRIIEYSGNCQSGCMEGSTECGLLEKVLFQMEDKMNEQTHYEDQIVDMAKDLDNYVLLISIPGISSNLAARILAEIGDISRFPRASSLVAYAGLDPAVYQSGEIDGLHLRITKKGNKNLRCLLYMAVVNAIQHENIISDYYHKKIASTRLSSKGAIVACMNKLLRIIYSMCKNGSLFTNHQ